MRLEKSLVRDLKVAFLAGMLKSEAPISFEKEVTFGEYERERKGTFWVVAKMRE